MYDTIIIGGGPAGCAAGVYIARKKINAMIIAEEFGGQSKVSATVENWLGDITISGYDLGKKFEDHVKAQEDLEIKEEVLVKKVEEVEGGFKVVTNKGEEFEAMTVIATQGARRRRLNVPGEDQFEGKGVVYCSTCDAPLFKDRKVAVIGGGNSGLEAVQDLIPYAKEITLLEYGSELKGDQITAEAIQKADNFKGVIFNAETTEILGDAMVSGLKYTDRESGEEKELDFEGIFVEIGAIPNSEIMGDLVELNDFKEIIINHHDSSTSKEGIWAAGDVTDEKFKQNNISAGDGVKAALAVHQYVLRHKK